MSVVVASRRPTLHVACAASSGNAAEPSKQRKRAAAPKGSRPRHAAKSKTPSSTPRTKPAYQAKQSDDIPDMLSGVSEELASAPDYSDEIEFQEDPPGHRAGFIAIIGRPNAGKSTLLNALLGQKLSIVTEKAQTTRHRILGIWSEPGHQAVFLDTPGIIAERRNELEERMMGAVDQAVKDADALLAIVDASRRPETALEMFQPGPDWKGPPMAVILNKCDLLPTEEVERLEKWFKEECRAETVIAASALHEANTDEVASWVVDHLPEGPSLYPKDVVADASERFFVGEIIRRQVFLQYRQELPYHVTVQVVEFKERRPPAKALVKAHVIVEKKRHVGILLGAAGSAIKALSTAAREEIEEFLEREIFLELSVKVEEGWREDSAQLERLGY